MATKVPLKDLCELITKGTTPTSIGFDFAEEGIGFLRVQNISGGTINFEEDTLFIDERVHQSLKRSQILPGDVLLSIAGSIGRTGIVPENAPPLNCNQAVAILRTSQNIYRPFLRHWLECEDAQKQMRGATVTGTIQNLSLTQIGELRIPLPSLTEQRRIAAILDQAEALRAKRREALALLDELQRGIFIEMFGDPSHNPHGWPIAQLSELVALDDSINYGVVQPGDDAEDGVPLVRVGDLVDGRVCHKQMKRIDPSIEAAYKRSRLKGDEILVSCVGSIGVVALTSVAEHGFNIARAVARIRLSAMHERIFFAAQLRTEGVQRYFKQELRTVSQPTLNIKQIAESRLMVPPLEVQREFASRVKAVEAIKASHVDAKNSVESLFSSLQHRAFRGEL